MKHTLSTAVAQEFRRVHAFRAVRRNRILLGAAACLASTGLAVACISNAPLKENEPHETSVAGSVVINENSIVASAARGGPIVLAHCGDGSDATFEMDRSGSTQIVTGRFKTPDAAADAVPLRLSAEFRRADSDDDSTIALADLAGSVIAPRVEKQRTTKASVAALPTTNAYALKALSFEDIQEPSGGHVSMQWGRSQIQLSGCHFNVAVLERMRGQEHLPFVLARAK